MKKESIIIELSLYISEEQIFVDEPMSKHTSFKTGGCADILVAPSNAQQFRDCLKFFAKHDYPYYVIGKGSNLLISDDGIEGAVIKVAENFSRLSIQHDLLIAESGASLKRLVNFAHINSMTGIEPLGGIPGTVGGGISMNAGAYGGEIKDTLIQVDVIDERFHIVTMSADDLALAYRSSIFQSQNKYVTKAVFKLEHGDVRVARQHLNEFNQRRKDKQPLNYPSAGSTFKRPVGYYAAKLIEDCGLKGYTIGGACVSELHSGFIINKDGATSRDIYNLIRYIQERVYYKEGVKLEPEVRLLGSFSNQNEDTDEV
jgi:UDP-N-acetylmuramate dehydrogenase